MKTTWTYDEKKVIIENGIVVYSDSAFCTIGQKPNVKALRACGWKKTVQPKPNYIKGFNGNTFSK